MTNVSLFKNAKSSYPYGQGTLAGVLSMVKAGTFKEKVEEYRATKNQDIKRMLPAYTTSGVFHKRSIADIEEYNGLVVIDIDKKDNVGVDFLAVKRTLRKAKTVIAYHDSVGGEGIAVYVKTDNKQISNHSIYYNALCDLFEQYLGVKCDRACSDVSRLRFFSYDEALYYNKNASEFHTHIEKPKQAQQFDIEKSKDFLLQYINKVIASGIDVTATYHDWRDIAMAFSDCFGEQGRQLFHALSMANTNYRYAETDRFYSNCLRRIKPATKITINSFYYICAKYGIKDID
jgi:hypothetical protein